MKKNRYFSGMLLLTVLSTSMMYGYYIHKFYNNTDVDVQIGVSYALCSGDNFRLKPGLKLSPGGTAFEKTNDPKASSTITDHNCAVSKVFGTAILEQNSDGSPKKTQEIGGLNYNPLFFGNATWVVRGYKEKGIRKFNIEKTESTSLGELLLGDINEANAVIIENMD